jgi:hypothetical protein
LISIETDSPEKLLQAIKDAIDDKHIKTWHYDDDGDFTHSAPQWNQQAWLRPEIKTGILELGILAPCDVKISTEVYAIYHGRFIEMILAHFDDAFAQVGATAMPTAADVIAA